MKRARGAVPGRHGKGMCRLVRLRPEPRRCGAGCVSREARPNLLSWLAILGSRGLVAQRLKNYEPRPQQLEMAEAVAAAIAGKQHLMVAP